MVNARKQAKMTNTKTTGANDNAIHCNHKPQIEKTTIEGSASRQGNTLTKNIMIRRGPAPTLQTHGDSQQCFPPCLLHVCRQSLLKARRLHIRYWHMASADRFVFEQRRFVSVCVFVVTSYRPSGRTQDARAHVIALRTLPSPPPPPHMLSLPLVHRPNETQHKIRGYLGQNVCTPPQLIVMTNVAYPGVTFHYF